MTASLRSIPAWVNTVWTVDDPFLVGLFVCLASWCDGVIAPGPGKPRPVWPGWAETTSATTRPDELCNPAAPAAGVLNALGVELRLTNAQATSRTNVTAALRVRRRRVDDPSSLRSTTATSLNIYCFSHSDVGGHHLSLALTDDMNYGRLSTKGADPYPTGRASAAGTQSQPTPTARADESRLPSNPDTGSGMAAPARTSVADPCPITLDRDWLRVSLPDRSVLTSWL